MVCSFWAPFFGHHPGIFIRPEVYTLVGVESVNGSSMNGDCPELCVSVIGGVRACDCAGTEDIINGAFIDDIVPNIDLTRRGGGANDFVWASQLYTARRLVGMVNVTINFRFSSAFTLHEVEIFLFNCPSLGIGAESIHVTDAGSAFPSPLRPFATDLGSVTLTDGMQNCVSLTRVSIQVHNPQNEQIYAIDISTAHEWVHIGEVRFSDQLFTTVADPSTQQPPSITGKFLSPSVGIHYT